MPIFHRIHIMKDTLVQGFEIFLLFYLLWVLGILLSNSNLFITLTVVCEYLMAMFTEPCSHM